MEQKLSKQRPNPGTRSLGELEAIVVNIFDSIAGGASGHGAVTGIRGSQPPKARAQSSWRMDEETDDFSEVWQEPVSPSEAPRQPQRQRRPGDAPAEQAETPADDPDLGAETEADHGYLLNEEEEKFVEQTVAWLSSRANPDILLDCIWNRLITLTEEEEGGALCNEKPVQEPDQGCGEEGST